MSIIQVAAEPVSPSSQQDALLPVLSATTDQLSVSSDSELSQKDEKCEEEKIEPPPQTNRQRQASPDGKLDVIPGLPLQNSCREMCRNWPTGSQFY